MKTHKIGYFTLSIVSMVLAPSFAMASTSSTKANLQKAKLPDMIQNSVGMVNMDHSSMDMSGMDHSSMDMSGMDHTPMLSYWKPLGIFWNGRLGVAYDTAMDDATIIAGIDGTAPYFIETTANAYLYPNGQLRLNAGAEYEWRFNQHWVVIPEVEITAFSKDDHSQHIKKGFNELESKVRLTYETLNRQVAPYIGVSYETALGANRGQHRAHGESVDSSSVIAGLSFWF